MIFVVDSRVEAFRSRTTWWLEFKWAAKVRFRIKVMVRVKYI